MGDRLTPEPFRTPSQRRQFVKEHAYLAMPRDASWERRPSTTSGGKFHVVDTATYLARCGQPMMPNDDRAVELDEVESWQRCMRPGCRHAWPKEPDHG